MLYTHISSPYDVFKTIFIKQKNADHIFVLFQVNDRLSFAHQKGHLRIVPARVYINKIFARRKTDQARDKNAIAKIAP